MADSNVVGTVAPARTDVVVEHEPSADLASIQSYSVDDVCAVVSNTVAAI